MCKQAEFLQLFPCYIAGVSQRDNPDARDYVIAPSHMPFLLAFWSLIYSVYILQSYLVILAHFPNYSQFAQELLSTFSTDLGEVALQPATGGVFSIEIFYNTTPGSTTQAETGTITSLTVESKLLWDRKTEGGFPGKSCLQKHHRRFWFCVLRKYGTQHRVK